ncbi:hypothetical protein D3C73_921550 [compost metagenome]|jgi:hypothetical protein
MKTCSLAVVLSGALLFAAPTLAQTTQPTAPAPGAGTAAATLPGAFDESAAARPVQAPPAPAPAAQAPDVARAEAALRAVIAAFQSNQIDYAVFSPDLADQIRAQAGQVAPMVQQFGALKSVEHRGSDDGADLFRVVFDNQATDWVIAFNEDDQIAALLFRPARD